MIARLPHYTRRSPSAVISSTSKTAIIAIALHADDCTLQRGTYICAPQITACGSA